MAGDAIQVHALGKKFCRSLGRSMLYGLADMGADLLGRRIDRRRLRDGEYWALDDVGFSVAPGECLGVIGHNGAGKSTLLKLLAGVLSPDWGEIRVRGRVGTLIEIGPAFHPMLSGRENVYLNGAVLGMRKREIDARFDEIVDFAGVGQFLDSPVKHYSSGMYVRLGFAVAVHTRPDVLLVDEALAVGDAAFRVKCLNRIAALKSEGVAVLFVSHSEIDVTRVADRCLLLARDRRPVLGSPEAVLQRYRAMRLAALPTGSLHRAASGDVDNGVAIVDVSVSGPGGVAPTTGESCEVVLDVDCDAPRSRVGMELRWWNSDEQLVAVLDGANTVGELNLVAGRQQIRFFLDSLDLVPDIYRLAGGLLNGDQIVAWSVELARVEIARSAVCPKNGIALLRAAVRVETGVATTAADNKA